MTEINKKLRSGLLPAPMIIKNYVEGDENCNYEKYLLEIENRLSRFQAMTETKDAIHVTLICGNGYKRSKYSGIVQNVIVGDDLFTSRR